jgi:hypothetical protein
MKLTKEELFDVMYGDRTITDSLQMELIQTNFNMQINKLLAEGAIVQKGNMFEKREY